MSHTLQEVRESVDHDARINAMLKNLPKVTTKKDATSSIAWLRSVAERLREMAAGREILPHDARVYADSMEATAEQLRRFVVKS